MNKQQFIKLSTDYYTRNGDFSDPDQEHVDFCNQVIQKIKLSNCNDYTIAGEWVYNGYSPAIAVCEQQGDSKNPYKN